MRSVHVETLAKLLRAKHSPKSAQGHCGAFWALVSFGWTEMQVDAAAELAELCSRGCHRK